MCEDTPGVDMSEKDKIFLTRQEATTAVRADFSQYGLRKSLLFGLCPLILGSDIAVVKDPQGKGVWHSTTGRSRRFIKFSELGDFLCDTLEDLSDLNLLADVCRRVFRAVVYTGKSSDGEHDGLWLETGMEGFKCRQCGRCCETLVFHTDATVQDYAYWESIGRQDIMDRVSLVHKDGKLISCQIWVVPGTRNYEQGCPWLQKIPDQNRYQCGIHNVRPGICRQYPGTRKHAEMTGCIGFSR